MSQSKFSGTRKFTLRYQKFRIIFDIDISRVDCSSRDIAFDNCEMPFVNLRAAFTQTSKLFLIAWSWQRFLKIVSICSS